MQADDVQSRQAGFVRSCFKTKQKAAAHKVQQLFDGMTRPVSRVLSCVTIYLRLASPQGSSRHYA